MRLGLGAVDVLDGLPLALDICRRDFARSRWTMRRYLDEGRGEEKGGDGVEKRLRGVLERLRSEVSRDILIEERLLYSFLNEVIGGPPAAAG